MSYEFYYFIICLLIPRLLSHWREGSHRAGFRRMLIVTGTEILLQLPLMSWSSLPLFLVLLFAYHALEILLEKKCDTIMSARIIEFLLIMIAGSFVFGIFDRAIYFNNFFLKIFQAGAHHNALLSHLTAREFKQTIVTLFALLILVNEANNLIRYILGLIKAEPQIQVVPATVQVDVQQLHRGKVIGVIERILFFFFVITGNYTLIAFILTAKGFTRYKELDDKNFAEYVLIGTLLSSTLSIVWAYYIKGILASI